MKKGLVQCHHICQCVASPYMCPLLNCVQHLKCKLSSVHLIIASPHSLCVGCHRTALEFCKFLLG